MLYKVRRTCTDFDGTYYTAGMIVELNGQEKHSSWLIPVEAETKNSAPAPATKSKPAKRRRSAKIS